LRTEIEDLTDRLAFAPWKTLEDDEVAELERFAVVMRQAVVDADVFPPGAFASRWGAHR
jgi:hypothetical protein